MYRKLARRVRTRRNERDFNYALVTASPAVREELLAARARHDGWTGQQQPWR